MKTIHLLFFVLFVTNQHFAQDTLAAQKLLDKRIPAWVKPVIEKSEVAKNYTIIDDINPFYLEADLTGDRLDDIVFLVQSKFDGKKGVMIINRGKNTLFIMGAGKDLGMGDHINWCNSWFIYRDKGLFDGTGHRKATLKYPALLIPKSEKLNLYIYWTGKKYKTHIQAFSE
jgi:hypothetical protein